VNIVIAVADFDFDSPGGVSTVVIRMIDALSSQPGTRICVASFANRIHDENSVALLNPYTYRNRRQKEGLNFNNVLITKFGAFGSEFEVMRYRRRHELKEFFNGFDRVIVVTGVLSFANVIPKVKVPVYVQCATRVSWERKSQYSEMGLLRRISLRLQLPLLLLQETRVLRSRCKILVENSAMFNWVEKRAKVPPTKWYPGVSRPSFEGSIDVFKKRTGSLVSVGRFNEPRKGWGRLLAAYKQAYEIDPRVPSLKLIGWGDFSPELANEIRELQKILPLLVLANLSNEDRDFELHGASFFIQASHEEGLGLAAIEALSYGTPLVCAETDGSAEYISPDINGILVDQGADFENRFARAILAIHNQDYYELHQGSLALFESKFEARHSAENLLHILQIKSGTA